MIIYCIYKAQVSNVPHEHLHRSDRPELNEVKYRPRGIPQQRKEGEEDINLEINLDIKQCATQANKNIGLSSAGHSARQIIYQWLAPASDFVFFTCSGELSSVINAELKYFARCAVV